MHIEFSFPFVIDVRANVMEKGLARDNGNAVVDPSIRWQEAGARVKNLDKLKKGHFSPQRGPRGLSFYSSSYKIRYIESEKRNPRHKMAERGENGRGNFFYMTASVHRPGGVRLPPHFCSF
jgi:hypothetical protein